MRATGSHVDGGVHGTAGKRDSSVALRSSRDDKVEMTCVWAWAAREQRRGGFTRKGLKPLVTRLPLLFSEPDAVVVRAFRFEPDAAGAVRVGLRSGIHSSPFGTAGEGQALVPSEPVGEADQDRREGSRRRSLHHLPDGGGDRFQRCLRGNPVTNPRTTMLYGAISHRFPRSRSKGPSEYGIGWRMRLISSPEERTINCYNGEFVEIRRSKERFCRAWRPGSRFRNSRWGIPV